MRMARRAYWVHAHYRAVAIGDGLLYGIALCIHRAVDGHGRQTRAAELVMICTLYGALVLLAMSYRTGPFEPWQNYDAYIPPAGTDDSGTRPAGPPTPPPHPPHRAR